MGDFPSLESHWQTRLLAVCSFSCAAIHALFKLIRSPIFVRVGAFMCVDFSKLISTQNHNGIWKVIRKPAVYHMAYAQYTSSILICATHCAVMDVITFMTCTILFHSCPQFHNLLFVISVVFIFKSQRHIDTTALLLRRLLWRFAWFISMQNLVFTMRLLFDIYSIINT